MVIKNPRQHLLEIYKAALESVQGEACVREALKQHAIEGSVAVVAIGKAAASMMSGAVSVLGDQLDAGLIITKSDHCGGYVAGESAVKRIQCFEAGHPVPDESSLFAGKELLSFISRQPASRTLVFLISGGTSSLVEVLPEGLSLTDLQKVNEWLLGSGLDIVAMNNIRTHFSCLKGGRLAKTLNGRKVINFMISDVPGDIPHVIGSGLLSPNSLLSNTDRQNPVSEVQKFRLPEWLDDLLNQLPKEGTQAPLTTDTCFKSIDTYVIATIYGAMQAAAATAKELGYEIILHKEMISGDALVTGKKLAHDLCDSEPALHVWGGETTVCLPEDSGVGGRNQHLALAAATVLNGHNNCWLLSAGTDGSDGLTADAGALVDGETLARGVSAGFEAEKVLANANAGAFLAATGDLISTGPTGTNVMDLVIGLKIES